jgi:predicted dehydrogenase
MAHQLNNALYLASATPGECAQPARVRSELYRAHPIETEDTTCTEIVTREGAKIYFYTTLCSKHHFNHTAWRVTGTKASATFEGKQLQLSRGESVVETLTYSDKQLGSVEDMVENAALFLQGKVNSLFCAFEKTRPFVATVEAMFDSSQQVRAVPAGSVRRLPIEDTTATEIVDIDELLQEAAVRRVLLSDLKVPWAAATKPVSLLD